MERYFCNPNENLPVMKIDLQRGGQPIWVGAPILSPPRIWTGSSVGDIVTPLRHHLVLDLNLVAQIRGRTNRENIGSLFEKAAERSWQLEIQFAAVEQHRTHADPLLALEECASAIQQHYPVQVLGKLDQFSSTIFRHLNDLKSEIQILADFCVVIKYFYRKNWGLRRKISEFSALISSKLPCLTTGYLLGCLLFYAKENRDEFPEFFDKIQSDMHFFGDPEKDRTAALNLASDLSYFTYSTLGFRNIWKDDFHMIRVASSDAAMGLILREMCYVVIDIENSIPYGTAAYRPNSIAETNLKEIVIKFMPSTSQPLGVKKNGEDPRRSNLKAVAEEFLVQ